jgi:hypothetical protein
MAFFESWSAGAYFGVHRGFTYQTSAGFGPDKGACAPTPTVSPKSRVSGRSNTNRMTGYRLQSSVLLGQVIQCRRMSLIPRCEAAGVA